MASKSFRYSPEEKAKHVRDFQSSGLSREDYCQNCGISVSSLARWLNGNLGRKQSSSEPTQHHGPRKPHERIQTVETYLQSGLSIPQFASTWGVSRRTLYRWLRTFEMKGPLGLQRASLTENAKKRGKKGVSEALKNEIAKIKIANQDFGIRKISDFLKRFGGVSVSKNTVSKILKEKNLEGVKVETKRRRAPPRPRRFERAVAMQLWQTDITSFLLPKSSQRCYLVAFLDDYSRYIVAWSLELRQTTDFVMRALLSGIDRFGCPEEVLSDQGRQYFTWRGKNEFQKLLKNKGIKHVVSRSHHPETVGKCERLWETIQKELWERIIPLNLEDAQQRIGHYINHYNHFRTHQGLDGMVPADRFFGLEAEVRRILEKSFTENELRLAVGERPRSPVFLLGQIGDQKICMHGESGKLQVQLPNGGERHINYEEFGHGKEREGRIEGQAGWTHEAAQTEAALAIETGDSSERTLGSSDTGGAQSCSEDGDGAAGVLDGACEQGGNGGEARASTAPSVADVAAGDLGDARRPSVSTEKMEDGGRNGIGKRQGIEGPHQRAGEDCRITEHSHQRDEDDAGDA